MCKKVLVAALAVVVVLGGVSMTRVGSRWISHVKQRANRWAEKQITPEMEIAHLRDKVKQLKSEEVRVDNEISDRNLDLQKRETALAPEKETLAKADKRLRELRPAIHEAKQSNRQVVTYNSQEYTIAQAEDQVSKDWALVKSTEPLVKSQEQYIEKLRGAIARQREKREELRRMRTDMLTQLQDLENALVELRQKQALEGAVDGTAHARVQHEINGLKQKMKSMEGAGVRERGPIEVAEEQRERQVKESTELNDRYPVVAPKAKAN